MHVSLFPLHDLYDYLPRMFDISRDDESRREQILDRVAEQWIESVLGMAVESIFYHIVQINLVFFLSLHSCTLPARKVL